jgi:hypothetical protein
MNGTSVTSRMRIFSMLDDVTATVQYQTGIILWAIMLS